MAVVREKVPMMDGKRILWMYIGFISRMIIRSRGGRILLDGGCHLEWILEFVVGVAGRL